MKKVNKIKDKKKIKRKSKSQKNFDAFVENKLIPAFSKFGSLSMLVTIRDAFSLMIPIIIVGSLGVLGANFIFGGGADGSSTSTSIIGWIAKAAGGVNVVEDGPSSSWVLTGAWREAARVGNEFFSWINTATFGSFSIYASFLIAWRWAALKNAQNPLLAGLTGLASFLIFSQVDPYFFTSTGLLAAIVVAFAASSLYVVFERNKKLTIKLPKGVPASVANGFAALFPIILVLLIISAFNTIAWSIGYFANLDITSKGEVIFEPGTYGFAGLFFRFVSAPFLSFAGSKDAGLGIGMLYIFMYSVFFWFGIHGGNVLNGIFYPIWFGLIQSNADLIASGVSKFDGSLAVFNMAFWETNVMVTGSGLTGALILCTWIFSKNKKYKEINKIAGPAAIFNINEPVVFGYPLMLDPILGIAQVFAMPIFTIIAWLFVGPFGLVAHSYIYVPWTMPAGVGSLLSTGLDWKAFVLTWGILALAFAYYLPFVLIKNKYDAILDKKEIKTEQHQYIAQKEADDIFAQAAKKQKKD